MSDQENEYDDLIEETIKKVKLKKAKKNEIREAKDEEEENEDDIQIKKRNKPVKKPGPKKGYKPTENQRKALMAGRKINEEAREMKKIEREFKKKERLKKLKKIQKVRDGADEEEKDKIIEKLTKQLDEMKNQMPQAQTQNYNHPANMYGNGDNERMRLETERMLKRYIKF